MSIETATGDLLFERFKEAVPSRVDRAGIYVAGVGSILSGIMLGQRTEAAIDRLDRLARVAEKTDPEYAQLARDRKSEFEQDLERREK